ncbi:MAG: hypothetical protein IKH04_03100, partial [Kiritimatiellae bacterium]|nr:hypothetical protein [Kiritimatiellia bacterium]
TIYLASGVYTACQPSTTELSLSVITNRAVLQILGGYAGSGAPGARDEPLHDSAVDLGVHERAGCVAAVCERKRDGGKARLEVADLVAPGVQAVE